MFVLAAPRNLGPKTNKGLTFDSVTATLTATAFSGPLTGNVTGNASGSSASCTGNAATATALQTARAIYGNNFDGTAALGQVIASTYGGTGNGFTKISGPTTSEKTVTIPDANLTITTAAATVLDDTTVGAMVDTLGGATSTGTGGIARATSPVFVTPALGTPASGTLTNCMGLPPAGLTTAAKTRSIGIVIDGGGSAITTGVKGDISVPFACTITGARLLANESGSIVIDVWKDTYANFPPTDADSITASAPPTLTAATKSDDTTLTGWATSITAGDTLRFNVDSITTCTRVVLQLTVTLT